MKSLMLSVFLYLFSLNAIAQSHGVKWGVKGGMTFSKLNSKEGLGLNSYGDLKPSAFIGSTATVVLSPSFSFQPGLLFVAKGGKGSFDAGDETLELYWANRATLIYVEVPLNLLYVVPGKKGSFFLGGGPYYGFGILGSESVDMTYEGSKSSATNNNFGFGKPHFEDDYSTGGGIKRRDFGLNLLMGYGFKTGFGMNAGYGLGIANISQSERDKLRNRVWSAGVSFDF